VGLLLAETQALESHPLGAQPRGFPKNGVEMQVLHSFPWAGGAWALQGSAAVTGFCRRAPVSQKPKFVPRGTTLSDNL
jgi:hypothetical protein